MKKIVGRSCLAAAVALATAGCGISSLDSAMAKPVAGPSVTLTERAAPSVLVTVTDGAATGPGPGNHGPLCSADFATPRPEMFAVQALKVGRCTMARCRGFAHDPDPRRGGRA